jgi:hypothetical protein
MQMGYPIEVMGLLGGHNFYTRTQFNVFFTPTGYKAFKNVSCTYIPGPRQFVLFVVMNARESAGVGVTIGDGTSALEAHQLTLNADDNPPTNPHIVAEGETAEGRALRVVCNHDCLPMILAYIKEWEYTYGNSSDRASAMRFWADHGYRWFEDRFVANGLDIGSPQTISFKGIFVKNDADLTRDAYTVLSDQPLAWRSACKVYTTDNSWAYSNQCALTSTFMPAGKVTLPAGNTTNFVWTNGYAADASRLPYEDYMISYLVYRRWVNCNEEYPEVQINDPARFAHTICVMANIMALAADLSSQQSDFCFAEIYCAPRVLRQSPMSALRQKNALWPALEQILTNGIQYPQYWNNRDVNFHRYESSTYWDVVYTDVFPTSVANGTVLASVARIPMSIAGQWFKPLYPQYIHLRLNLREMKPQRIRATIDGVARLLFQCFYSEEQTGMVGRMLAPISWLMWRLSMGVMATVNSPNNGFMVQVANNMTFRDYYVHYEGYDSGRNQVLVREFHSGGVTVPPTTAAALPTGEFLLKRSIVDALQPVSLVMQGPQDAFIGVGIGSTAYQLFVQTNTPQALFVSESWATVPNWLFSERGLMSERDTI